MSPLRTLAWLNMINIAKFMKYNDVKRWIHTQRQLF